MEQNAVAIRIGEQASQIIQVEVNKQYEDRKLPKPTEASQILQRSLNFVSKLGILIGMDMNYQWKRNPRFIISFSLAAFTWSQLLYTQFLFVYNNDSIRTLEIFAIYGVGISVINS